MEIQAETIRGIVAMFVGFGGMAIVALISWTLYSMMTVKKPDPDVIGEEDDNEYTEDF